MTARRSLRQTRLVLFAPIVVAALAVAAATATRATAIVFVGTFTTETNPKSASRGIYAFRFDDATGALTPLGLAAATISPSQLVVSADGRFLFATNELQTVDGVATGLVSSFAIDRATGQLTQLSEQQSRGAGPCQLSLDRTGRYLAVANYTSGNYAIFPVGPDGRLQPASSVVAGEPTTGPDGAPLQPLGHMVRFDRANRYLIASDKGLNKLLVFRFDASTGAVTPNTPPSVSLPRPRSGPRHFAFDPTERFLFSIAEQAATITSFAWNAAAGTLAALGSVPTRPDGTTGSTADIGVHPSGRFVYGSNRGHNSIAAFKVDDGGPLTLVEYEPTRGTTPRAFRIDPTGRWLIAANQGSGTLAVFAIDQVTGALDPVGPLVPAETPVAVVFLE